MNTKNVMIGSAAFMAAIGLTLSFLPDEILTFFQAGNNPVAVIACQLLGATYLGLAMLNGMSKGITIGGIYNKPIAVGNFMHFAVGVMALMKIQSKMEINKEVFVVLTIIYAVFALLYGYIFRTHPMLKN
ncbi:MAG: hypothetical protein ACPGRC_10025 [Salibacteraceae bacterium]